MRYVNWTMLLALAATACGTTTAADDATAADVAGDDAATADAQDAVTADVATTDTLPGDTVPDDTAQADTALPDVAKTDAALPDATPADTSTVDTAQPDATAPDVAPDAAAAPFAPVQAVFDARCTNCHAATALGLPGYAALPLTSDFSYKNLVNKPANEACGGTLVVPGKPDQSYLWQKLTSDAPCSGSHMPAKFEVMPAPPLTTDQLAAIEAWIASGALP